MTLTARAFSKDEMARAQARERRAIVSRFNAADEGRSRVAVAICVDPNDEQAAADAAFIVRACNAHEELVEVVRRAIKSHEETCPAPEDCSWTLEARAALKKATGPAC